MNSYLRKVLGLVKVVETETELKITGLPADAIINDIYRYWRTSKIATSMFSFTGRTAITLPKFFALEFVYILDELQKNNAGRTGTRILGNVRKEVIENSWLSNIESGNIPPILDRSKLQLFNRPPLTHQKQFLDAYEHITPRYNLNGYVVAMGVGTGKTNASLYLVECLNVDHVVILPPARAARTVWPEALTDDYRRPQTYWSAVRDGALPAVTPRYTIFHYEALGYLVQCARAFMGKRVAVIIDESHNLNELSAERTQNMLKFCSLVNPVSVQWLSATPIKALGSEMIPMLRSFDPLFTDDVEQRFKAIFGRNSTKANDIVKNRMGVVSYKVEVVKSAPEYIDLPVKIPNATPFTLDQIRDDMMAFIKERTNYYKANFAKYESLYKHCLGYFEGTLVSDDQRIKYQTYLTYIEIIRQGFDARTMMEYAKYCNIYEKDTIMPVLPPDLRAEFKDARSVIKYVELKVRGECLGRVIGRRRTEAVLATIPYCDLPTLIRGAKKKTVIFTSYIEAVKLAEEICVKAGFKPLMVYGDTNRDLKSMVARFHTDPNVNPMIATYQSLSTAVPLTAASTMIALNAPFREHDYQQAVGRIDRINQDVTTEVINVTLDTGTTPNITGRTIDIREWSKQQVDQIMGDKSGYTIDLTMESIGLDDMDHDDSKGATFAFPTNRPLVW